MLLNGVFMLQKQKSARGWAVNSASLFLMGLGAKDSKAKVLAGESHSASNMVSQILCPHMTKDKQFYLGLCSPVKVPHTVHEDLGLMT